MKFTLLTGASVLSACLLTGGQGVPLPPGFTNSTPVVATPSLVLPVWRPMDPQRMTGVLSTLPLEAENSYVRPDPGDCTNRIQFQFTRLINTNLVLDGNPLIGWDYVWCVKPVGKTVSFQSCPWPFWSWSEDHRVDDWFDAALGVGYRSPIYAAAPIAQHYRVLVSP